MARDARARTALGSRLAMLILSVFALLLAVASNRVVPVRANAAPLLLPRAQVTATTGVTETEGLVVVDETDQAFIRAGTLEFWEDAIGGYGGHYYWAGNNEKTKDQIGTWTLTVPMPGQYEVFVYIPADHATTTNAVYEIHHAGQTDQISVDQSAHHNEWYSLGTFAFDGTSDEFVRLTDRTGEKAWTTEIAFDAVGYVAHDAKATPTRTPPITSPTPSSTPSPTLRPSPPPEGTPPPIPPSLSERLLQFLHARRNVLLVLMVGVALLVAFLVIKFWVRPPIAGRIIRPRWRSRLLVGLGTFAVCGLALITFIAYRYDARTANQTQQPSLQSSSQSPTPLPPTSVTDQADQPVMTPRPAPPGWQTSTDGELGFSIQYPVNWYKQDKDEFFRGQCFVSTPEGFLSEPRFCVDMEPLVILNEDERERFDPNSNEGRQAFFEGLKTHPIGQPWVIRSLQFTVVRRYQIAEAPAIELIETDAPGLEGYEPFYAISVYINHPHVGLIQLSMLALDQKQFKQHEHVLRQMLDSFILLK